MSDQLASQYSALTSGTGFVVLDERCFVRLTGLDRHSFFHNFCTNDIKGLQSGQACEAFVLNTKGKILGFVHALATSDELLLTGHGNQSAALIAHLDMYLIREDVELADATEELASVFVCGDQAKEALASAGVELPMENQVLEQRIDAYQIQISNIELAGFGFLIICPVADLDDVTNALDQSGAKNCSLDALHKLRVEKKTPWFGIDADDSNLPQELQRDEKAINFNKGCYLGQETVARIDARGRVNQLLVGLTFSADPPVAGDSLIEDEKPAGRVTSVAKTIHDDGYIGLGYVRRAFKDAGTQVGKAVVRE